MKVAFFVNSFPIISETFILNQITGLIRRGHDVVIDAGRLDESQTKHHRGVDGYDLLNKTRYREAMPRRWLPRASSACLRIAHWGWRHPLATLDSLNPLAHGWQAVNLSLLHDTFPVRNGRPRYDIIHCHFGPNGERAVRMRNAGVLRGPIVTSFYGYDANVLPRIQGPRLYKKLFSCGDKFLVGSEFLRNRILSLGAPKHRITKLQMGADLSQFRFAARVKGREFRLLTVARLVEVKGVEYAIRSLALLKVKCPHVRYVIAGDGPLRRRLELLVDELGLANQVDFVGAVSQEEALPLFEAAHAFVLPSVVTDSGEEEGQPIVLAEAQASGLPVIATAIGGIPESIRNKESGFLVPPGDPEALASAILWLAYHPEKWGRMGRAGRAHVEKSYDLENLNDRLIDIYHAVSNAKLFRDE